MSMPPIQPMGARPDRASQIRMLLAKTFGERLERLLSMLPERKICCWAGTERIDMIFRPWIPGFSPGKRGSSWRRASRLKRKAKNSDDLPDLNDPLDLFSTLTPRVAALLPRTSSGERCRPLLLFNLADWLEDAWLGARELLHVINLHHFLLARVLWRSSGSAVSCIWPQSHDNDRLLEQVTAGTWDHHGRIQTMDRVKRAASKISSKPMKTPLC